MIHTSVVHLWFGGTKNKISQISYRLDTSVLLPMKIKISIEASVVLPDHTLPRVNVIKVRTMLISGGQIKEVVESGQRPVNVHCQRGLIIEIHSSRWLWQRVLGKHVCQVRGKAKIRIGMHNDETGLASRKQISEWLNAFN